jgi:hypothetical protein
VSTDERGGCSISMLGVKLPIRLLKSPHMIVINYGWAKLSRSSIYYVAVFCCILRFNND